MKYLPVIVVLIALFATGEAIKCYSCTSSDPKCANPFDKNSGVKENDYVNCFCTKIDTITTNGTFTIRDCMVPNFSSRTANLKAADSTFKSMEINFCNEHLCNGASTYTAALSTLMGVATLLVFSSWH